MKLFERCHGNAWAAKECLQSFIRGEESTEANAGALLAVEFLALVRSALTSKK